MPKKRVNQLPVKLFEKLRNKNFEVLMLHHAEAILSFDMPEAATEIETILDHLMIPAEELVRAGGGGRRHDATIASRIINAIWLEKT